VVADLTLDRQMTSDTGESRAGAGLDRVPFVTPAVPPFRKRQFTVTVGTVFESSHVPLHQCDVHRSEEGQT
jgi:hypothetical protein